MAVREKLHNSTLTSAYSRAGFRSCVIGSTLRAGCVLCAAMHVMRIEVHVIEKCVLLNVSAVAARCMTMRWQVKVECSSLEDLEAAEACLRTMYLQESPLRGTPSSWDPDTSIAFLLKVK
eukprot:1158935-Pelagomonas_calceolata.AAC.3